MENKISNYLEFRKQFTPLELYELNKMIDHRFKEKADQLILDDFDLKVISERVKKTIH